MVDEVGRGAHRQCDVRERAGGHEPHTGLRSARLDDEADGIHAVGATVGHGEIGSVEAALAVDEPGELRLGDERPDVVVCVVDATCLSGGLYLILQILRCCGVAGDEAAQFLQVQDIAACFRELRLSILDSVKGEVDTGGRARGTG